MKITKLYKINEETKEIESTNVQDSQIDFFKNLGFSESLTEDKHKEDKHEEETVKIEKSLDKKKDLK